MSDLPVRTLEDLATKIITEHRLLFEDGLTRAIRMGELLTEANDLVQHGDWQDWCDNNLPFTYQHANKLRRLYDNKDKLLETTSNRAYMRGLPKVPTVTDALKLIASPKKKSESKGEEKPPPAPKVKPDPDPTPPKDEPIDTTFEDDESTPAEPVETTVEEPEETEPTSPPQTEDSEDNEEPDLTFAKDILGGVVKDLSPYVSGQIGSLFKQSGMDRGNLYHQYLFCSFFVVLAEYENDMETEQIDQYLENIVPTMETYLGDKARWPIAKLLDCPRVTLKDVGVSV